MTREFDTGANRNSHLGKFEYYKFINPLNEHSFAKYMHGKRLLSDGTYRDADNWQKGIPQESLLDSLTRHVKELEMLHLGFILLHIEDDQGEHTMVFNNRDDAEDYIKHVINKENFTVVNKVDILNAIRFNSEAYKLQELGYLKKHE